jgi:hypothetical protein
MRCVEIRIGCEAESGFKWLRKGVIHDFCESANKSSVSIGEGSLLTTMIFIWMDKDFGVDSSKIDT